MADVYEMYNSRKVDLSSDSQACVLEFFLKGETDDAPARAAFDAFIPAIFSGLFIDTVSYECIGGDFWRATANYKALQSAVIDGGQGDPGNPPPAPGTPGGVPTYGDTDALGSEFAFDISGVTEHVTQSWFTRSKTKRNGGVAPDNKQAIGVTADGEVQGCDRISPHLEYSVTITTGFITLRYLGVLYGLTGKVNNAVFHGFPLGDVLLTGVSGTCKDAMRYTLTFKFAVQPTETDIDVCGDGTLIVPFKRGWDYLWISYKNVENALVLFQQADAAYVEAIYKPGNFALLGIGG